MDSFFNQAILNEDETTHVMEDLEPDTVYDVRVTAIYPDESESEDLMGNERTCKILNFFVMSCNITIFQLLLNYLFFLDCD